MSTPTFRIETRYVGGRFSTTPEAWPTKHLGRPTPYALGQWVALTEQSTKPGGVNAHLGPMTVRSARVVRQSTGEVVAQYVHPSYEYA